MIEVSISVTVDGITYAVDKDEQSNPGRDSTQKAIGFFESQVAKVKQAMRAHLPQDSVVDDRPAIESRIVESGPIDVKPTKRC